MPATSGHFCLGKFQRKVKKFEMMSRLEVNMKTRHQINFRSTENELRFIADAARIAGMSKTDFIFSAATEAAKKIGLDPEKYFVSEAKATPQNTGAGFFSHEVDQKVHNGVGQGAGAGRGAIAKQRPLGSGKAKL